MTSQITKKTVNKPVIKTVKKTDEVKVVIEKQSMNEIVARASFIRTGARKIRLVADQLRGKDVKIVLDYLQFLNKKATGPLTKLINSAVANAENNFGFEKKDLMGKDFDSGAQKYFFKDPWDGGSMILVNEGKKSIAEGFHLIVCHSDSPCLIIKPKPIKLEWAHDEIYNHLGVRLSAVAHGGLQIHQWIGEQVDILGYTEGQNGNKIQTRHG